MTSKTREDLIRDRDEIKDMIDKRKAVVAAAGDDLNTDRVLDFHRWALDGVERTLAAMDAEGEAA